MHVLYSNSRIFVIPVYIFNGRKQTLVDTAGYCQRCACVVCMTSASSWPNCISRVARILYFPSTLNGFIQVYKLEEQHHLELFFFQSPNILKSPQKTWGYLCLVHWLSDFSVKSKMVWCVCVCVCVWGVGGGGLALLCSLSLCSYCSSLCH